MKSKSEIRSLIRKRKKAFTSEQLREKSQVVMKRLLHHPTIIEAKTIMMYASLPDEVYTIDAIELLRKSGKQILLPQVVNETDMILRIYHGPESLLEGSFHIMEPTGEIFDNYEQIDVAVIPGMGFDKSKHRLGRGKGYYDRFLNQVHTWKIGICFDFQLLEEIPYENYDVVMDEIICELPYNKAKQDSHC